MRELDISTSSLHKRSIWLAKPWACKEEFMEVSDFKKMVARNTPDRRGSRLGLRGRW